jgi:F-type H+-transporting ATPase subunit a
MTNDPGMSSAATDGTTVRSSRRRRFHFLGLHPLFWAVVAVIVFDIVAFIVSPPFPREGQAGDDCAYPICYIGGTLEFPPPHVVWQLDPDSELSGQLAIGFEVSITNSILTMWIVMAILLVVAIAATRSMRNVPGRLQNLAEFSYESLHGFAHGLGGAAAVKHVPIYASFFLLILFCNWSGLIPPVGRIHELRAPTSDVNITIGLALVSFAYFQLQGFRANGVGYLARFFPFREFKNGVGAGLIAMFVGLVEFMLEFVKPVTLAMRLFGNIYGGEVALGVFIALTIGIIPVAMYSLELLLTSVQALIFSVLTLMFTVAATESHQHEEHEPAEHAVHGTPVQPPLDRPAVA